MDWSQGCVVNKSSSCEGDRFVKHPGLKVPETDHVDLYENIDLEECREKCLNNCYCVAYTNSDIRGGGKGCVHWYFELNDIRQFETGGQDLYIRMPALESGIKFLLIFLLNTPIILIILENTISLFTTEV